MNILYYSVHQILEDDEVRLFQSLGHHVCVLGINSDAGVLQTYRKPLNFCEQERDFYRIFRDHGGHYEYNRPDTLSLPKIFVELFDIIIVMHDVRVIQLHWQALRSKHVIWRTIGQGVDAYDNQLRSLREDGLRIVRYSEVERTIPYSLGEDAIIRFYKDSSEYGGWTGKDENVLTFINNYAQRYPKDASDYRQIVTGFPSALGGSGNDTFDNSIGMVEAEFQSTCYRDAGVYLYASGLYVPYTLNFMEAWMSGIPIVLHVPLDRRGPYFEIDDLVQDGKTGFVCRDVDQARRQIGALLADRALAESIGEAGRNEAIRLYGRETVRQQWQDLFAMLRGTKIVRAKEPNEDFPNSSQTPGATMITVSSGIFDILSLLRPFDIDLPKIRIGNERDGGYILADSEWGADVLSFGVGPDVTFEFEMAERGSRVFLHDHTVEVCPQNHPRFDFASIGVCGEDSHEDRLAPLSKLVTKTKTESGSILKMDVEGCEWDVFSTVSQELLEHFDQIVVEVHWLERLVDPAFAAKVDTSLKALNRQFTLFHVHGNNCAALHIVHGFTVASVLELSYIKTSKVRRSPSRTVYPSSLNKSNHPNFHDLPLLFYPFTPMSVEEHLVREMVKRVDMEQCLGR